MKISFSALLVAGSVFVAGSAVISCLGGLKPLEASFHSFAPNTFRPVLNALDFTFGLRQAHSSGSASLNASGPKAPEKPELPTLSEIYGLIRLSADKYRVPAEFVKSIVAAESNFQAEVVSPKGAIGLMQLMPETAREYGGDPNIPNQNIEAGTRYLKFLLEKYQRSRHPLVSTIAAYNAGPGAVDRYRGVPPFRETRGYVARVLGFLRVYQRQRG